MQKPPPLLTLRKPPVRDPDAFVAAGEPTSLRPAVVTSERQEEPTSLRPSVVTSQGQRWKPSRLRRDLPADQRERLTCWLPVELAARLRRAAADQRRAQADLVAEALELLLSR